MKLCGHVLPIDYFNNHTLTQTWRGANINNHLIRKLDAVFAVLHWVQ
jgi:hypothetical protein